MTFDFPDPLGPTIDENDFPPRQSKVAGKRDLTV
jgi:hypothetical protein